jgi:hypothetical protein
MTNKKNKVIYKSFEQFKAELFPRLSEEEEKKGPKWSPKQVGVSQANEAINAMLQKRQN